MSETQTTTNPGARPTGAAASVDADFDALAEGFDKATTPTQTPSPRSTDPVRDWAAQEMQRQFKTSVDKAVNDSVKVLKEGDERLAKLPNKFLRGYLYDHAAENPAFEQAFKDRDANPVAWRKALNDLAKVAAEESDQPDSKLTDDMAAARASVRGTSTDAPDKPKVSTKDFRNMSDAEFRAYKDRLEDGA